MCAGSHNGPLSSGSEEAMDEGSIHDTGGERDTGSSSQGEGTSEGEGNNWTSPDEGLRGSATEHTMCGKTVTKPTNPQSSQASSALSGEYCTVVDCRFYMDTNGPEVCTEVSVFQRLKYVLEWVLGVGVSCLERCPQFGGVLYRGVPL